MLLVGYLHEKCQKMDEHLEVDQQIVPFKSLFTMKKYILKCFKSSGIINSMSYTSMILPANCTRVPDIFNVDIQCFTWQNAFLIKNIPKYTFIIQTFGIFSNQKNHGL